MASNEAQVRTLYQNILGREADPGGLKYWTDAANKLGMGQVAKAFRVEANKELGQRGTPEATNQIYTNIIKNQGDKSKAMANAYLAKPDRDPTTAAAIRMHEARMAIKRGEKTPDTLTQNEFPTLSTNFNPSNYFAGTKVYEDPRNQIRDQVKNWYSNEGETADARGLKYWTDQIGKGDKTFSNVREDFSNTLAAERAKKAAAAASLANSTSKPESTPDRDTTFEDANVNTTYQNVLSGLEKNKAAGGGVGGALSVLQGFQSNNNSINASENANVNTTFENVLSGLEKNKAAGGGVAGALNVLQGFQSNNNPINAEGGNVQYITDGPKPGKEWEEKYGSYEDYKKNLPVAKIGIGDFEADQFNDFKKDGIETGSTVDIGKIKDTYKEAGEGAGDNRVGIGDFEAEQFKKDDVLNKIKTAGESGASNEEVMQIIKDNPINSKGDMAFGFTQDDIITPTSDTDTGTSFDIDNTYEKDDYGSNLNSFESLLNKLEGSKKRQQRQRSVEGRRDTWAQGLASMMSNF